MPLKNKSQAALARSNLRSGTARYLLATTGCGAMFAVRGQTAALSCASNAAMSPTKSKDAVTGYFSD